MSCKNIFKKLWQKRIQSSEIFTEFFVTFGLTFIDVMGCVEGDSVAIFAGICEKRPEAFQISAKTYCPAISRLSREIIENRLSSDRQL